MSKKVISAMYISSSDSDDNTLTETFNENLHSSIPKASLRRAPKYKCSQFRITVQPRIYQIELEREDFFNSIKKDFEDVETIVSTFQHRFKRPACTVRNSVQKIFLKYL